MTYSINELTDLEYVAICGKLALFTNMRINRDNLPKGSYCYSIRSDDCGNGPATIEKYVLVNHFGDIILFEPLDFGGKDYISLYKNDNMNFNTSVLENVPEEPCIGNLRAYYELILGKDIPNA